MDYRYFRKDLKRLFIQKNGLILLLYSIGITLLHFLTFNRTNYMYEPSVFARMMGVDYTSYGTEIYFLTLPLIVSFYGAGLYREDLKWNLILKQEVRWGRKNYYKQQWITAFISGGLAGTFTYFFHAIFLFLIYPMCLPDVLQDQISMNSGLIYYLYTNHPLLILILLMSIIFVLSGIFSCMGLAASYWISARYFEFLFPFLSSYLLVNVFAVLGVWWIDYKYLLYIFDLTLSSSAELTQLLLFWLAIFLLSFLSFYLKYKGSLRDVN
ncbi:hypothetical protein [Facklamia hominis]|uniref:hypothetical protein n=1 Tax=Facklamia hominis TaxID=178214 RepID=UPI0038FBF3A4